MIIYSVFLFLVITVLLNLLIAQMNNTYTNVQDDAQRSLFIYRAQIVAKVEQNSFFASALFVRCTAIIVSHCNFISTYIYHIELQKGQVCNL